MPMILSFTAIDTNTQFREFFCQLAELEEALDLLSTIASQGDRILCAHLIDGKSRIELPVDALDGQSFASPLQQLEQQWQAALKEPARRSLPDKNWRTDLTRQRIQLYDDRISQIKQVISHIELLCVFVEETAHYEPRRTNYINHYQLLLATYHQQIERAQAGKQQALEKLNQLVRTV